MVPSFLQEDTEVSQDLWDTEARPRRTQVSSVHAPVLLPRTKTTLASVRRLALWTAPSTAKLISKATEMEGSV